MRALEVQDDPFGRAVRGVMILDGIEQLVPAKPGAPGPEVAAWHHDSRPYLGGIDHLAQCVIWVQANDDVIIAGHTGPVLFRAARDTTQYPAARIHDVAVDVMPLAENPGQHSLSACDVSGASGLGESGGNEVSRGLEPPLVTMKAMCRHRQTTNPILSAGRVPGEHRLAQVGLSAEVGGDVPGWQRWNQTSFPAVVTISGPAG